MQPTSRMYERHGAWIFITPIGNLALTEAVNREFQIKRVLFVDKNKLPRIRKRLGLNKPVSELKKSVQYADFFDLAETFAVVYHNGKAGEARGECFRLVREELSILSLSQLGYSKRRHLGHPSLLGEHGHTYTEFMMLNRNDASKIRGARVTSHYGTLVLSGLWRNFQKKVFFTKLISILNGQTPVAPSWRKNLTTVSILIGQSLNSKDTATSFLWNMIAMEILMSQGGEKYSDVLPKRVEAFLGWTGFWKTENYETKIQEVYKRRNDLVHRGDRDKITKRDLIFTDDLLLNLLMNIVNFPKLFSSKQAVVEFADLVEAEHKLGLKSRVRPKMLQYFSRSYTKEDFDETF